MLAQPHLRSLAWLACFGWIMALAGFYLLAHLNMYMESEFSAVLKTGFSHLN
jgi:hypothetical protein